MNIVIFEGISGAGKTTLMDAFLPRVDYQAIGVHRFTASQWVYAALRHHPVDVCDLLTVESRVAPRLLVLATVNPEVARLRKESQHDGRVERDLAKADMLFHIYTEYITSIEHKVIVDTSEGLSECVDKMLSAFTSAVNVASLHDF